MAYTINTVYDITELQANSAVTKVYGVNLNVFDDIENATYDTNYTTNGGDVAPLNLLILQWIEDHPEFPIGPYVAPEPPTIEEIRAAMPPLTRRQLRIGLINNGILPSQAQTIINAMPAGVDKEKFNVEWNDGDRFLRLAPTVITMLSALLFTPEQIDTIWTTSTNI